ncbi:MAG: acetylxylan esterase, partial [Bacteroidetes bacterium]|nr:acetylxylan esterase [Bacteroidota bacterium]
GVKGDPLNAFGSELAKNGIIVLSPDSIGFEDRRRNQSGTDKNESTDWLQYFNGMAYRLLKGELLMTTVLNDAIIGVDLLQSLPRVDKTNIGIMGHSYGGNTSIFHAAIDERIQFACASGSVCSYKNKIENETGIELSLIIPNILNRMDISDIVQCVSPRRILLVSATDDKYSKDAADIADKVHQNLKTMNEIDNVEHKQYEGNHALTKERFDFIIDWINKQAHK